MSSHNHDIYLDLWQLSDEVDTVVTAALGECQRWINIAGGAVALELDVHLDEEQAMDLCSQFYSPAIYDGEGRHGSLFSIFPRHDE